MNSSNFFKLTWAILFVFLVSCKTSKLPIAFPIQNMSIDMLTLASDEMEGRETGTQGELLAAEYLEKRFKEIGLTPMGTSGTYFQSFSKKIKEHPHAEPKPSDPEVTGKNVIGFIDNKAPYTVVIGAHYDHLGYGDNGSLHTGERAIHNGADDNASGVTGLLFLAESIKKSKLKKYNYLFVCFSGEEKGLWGSNYFVNNATIDTATVNYMLNLDMIGRLNAERKLAVGGIGTSPILERVIDQIKNPKFNIKKDMSGSGPSDHMSFYLAGIPVLSFFTGQHEDYHKPSDDAHLINYSGLKDVSEFVYYIVQNLDNKDKLPFTKTADPAPSTRTFSVTLGVMPDYLYDGVGMKLDGVREGKPAEAAGLKKGDIIKKLGDMEITDIKAYMQALGLYQPGDTVKVEIIRDEKPMTLNVTF